MASKNVSIDEFLNSRGYGGVERKHFARDSGVIIKAARVPGEKAGKFNKDAGTMRFIMSAEVEDRDRDIVVQAGLDTAEFEKNPVAPWSHRAGDPPVGKWTDLQKNLAGRPKRTEGTLNLTMADPMAQRLAAHFDAGSLCACSIGFMPKEIERRSEPADAQGGYFYPGYMIHSAELFECSPCTVPANPAALAKAAAAGDVLSRELIEEVLDTWTMEKGVLLPRKAFEDAHQGATGGRRSALIKAITQKVAAALPDDADPDAAEIEATTGIEVEFPITVNVVINQTGTTGDAEANGGEDEDEADDPALDPAQQRSLLTRIAKALGLKGKTEAADPVPEQDGKKPAPEPTPEQKLREQFTADLPALEAKHAILEADARMADLDSEMGQHVPA